MEVKVKALETAFEIVQNFVQSVVTPPLEEIGGIFTDKIRAHRLKNQIAIIEKAEEMLRKRGVKKKKVSLKAMASLLEECSWEEEEDLQKRWAALLTNTVSADKDIKTTIFTSVLKEISKEDAAIFQVIFEHCTIKEADTSGKMTTVHRLRAIFPTAFGNYPDINVIFDNLKRLRLIREISTHGSDQVGVVVTELGLQFMLACSE